MDEMMSEAIVEALRENVLATNVLTQAIQDLRGQLADLTDSVQGLATEIETTRMTSGD